VIGIANSSTARFGKDTEMSSQGYKLNGMFVQRKMPDMPQLVMLLLSLLESMVKYFSLVLAGLAGSPRMASCTLLSLSKLIFEFHGETG